MGQALVPLTLGGCEEAFTGIIAVEGAGMHLEDEFGDIISKARYGLGITIAQLAHEAGLSERAVEDIESYRLVPDTAVIDKLASLLSLDAPKLADIANQRWSPEPANAPASSMIVETIAVPYAAYGENAYIIGCKQNQLAAVVDPGGAIDEINNRLAEGNLNLETILITHAHRDHIGGLKQLAIAWPGAKLINHQTERDSILRGLKSSWAPAKDGINIHLGDLSITPLFTPGHTPGSMCYRIDSVCLVGDTLFAGSIGRPGSREVYKQMLAEIRSKILSIPEHTIILPGHGPATTVAEEKAHNPFF